MVKHTCFLSTNCLSVLDHFMRLALKGFTLNRYLSPPHRASFIKTIPSFLFIVVCFKLKHATFFFSRICIINLEYEVIEKHLLNDPSIVEDYVMKHISQDQIERWLIRKAQLKNRANSGGIV